MINETERAVSEAMAQPRAFELALADLLRKRREGAPMIENERQLADGFAQLGEDLASGVR
jgi:hypothetical protein